MSDRPGTDWEQVMGHWPHDYLDRVRVPGGWLYRTVYQDDSTVGDDPSRPVAVAMCFVPDPSGRGLT
jgi:hypothetical protein